MQLKLTKTYSQELKYFTDSIFNSYSQIFFSGHRLFAILLVLVTFFDYHVGLIGLLAVVASSVSGFILNLDKPTIAKGLFGFNSLLVGLGLGVYYSLSWELVFIVVLASLFTLFFSVAMQGIIGKYGVPFLSIPFLIALWSFTLATQQLGALGVSERGIYTLNELYTIGGSTLVELYEAINQIPLPKALSAYFVSLSAIFFQYNVLAGMLICVGILLYSRISFTLSLLGFFVAYGFYQVVEAEVSMIDYSYIGFNYILTAISIGGFFLIPSTRSYLSVMVLVPLVATITISLNMVMFYFRLPVYSLPFNIIVILYLYVLKFRLKQSKYLTETVDQFESPERNLYNHQTNVKRFHYRWFTPIKLPFYGVWNVSQGYEGKYTHKDSWRHAFDFVIIDEQGSQYRGEGYKVEDYYCYNKPVIAPDAGVIEEVIDEVDDNVIGEENFEQNWGNTVIINHTQGVYSKLSHLKKGTIKVKKGDPVKYGQVIGNCGNSGRSPYPHLHFQLQAYPYVGSVTMDYPISNYVLHHEGQTIFKMQEKPKEGQSISNVSINALIDKAFNWVPGQILSFTIEGYPNQAKVDWEVKANYYGYTYLYCRESGSIAYFEKSDNQFMFTQFIGAQNCLLNLFYLAIYRVQKGFYKDMEIQDEFPLDLCVPKTTLWFHDFVAPFINLIKSSYYLRYDYLDDDFSPSEIRLTSKVRNSFFSHKLSQIDSEIILNTKGISSITTNTNKQTIMFNRDFVN